MLHSSRNGRNAACGATRRTITATTAAALGLLGAILILLIGLPLVAAIGGWLFAGREPPAVTRQQLE